MNLTGLLELIRESSDCKQLVAGNNQNATVLDAVKAPLLATLYHDLKLPTLVIVRDVEKARKLVDDLISWCLPGVPVHRFPELGVLPYEQLMPDVLALRQRLRTLGELNIFPANLPPLVVIPAHALSQKTISYADFEAACFEVRKESQFNPQKLMLRMSSIGYEICQVVEDPGQASRRGGIVDVYSLNNDRPARIEFFGNEVESIRWFDPDTQRSVDIADSLRIIPAQETFLQSTVDVQNASLNDSSIIDHFPVNSLIVFDDPEGIVAELSDMMTQAEGIRNGLIERGELHHNFPRPYFAWSELQERMARMPRILSLPNWVADSGVAHSGFGSPPGYGGQLSNCLKDISKWMKDGYRVIIVSQQAERVSELLRERDIISVPVLEIEHLPPQGSLTIVRGSLSKGWTLENNLLLTDSELFGFNKKSRPQPVKRSQRETFIADLSIGDFVVHVDHGVARFLGMVTMTSEGAQREYLNLEYADDGILYVPSDQVDRVARYVGSRGYSPSLSKLHTQEWARTKERVKKATVEMAEELLSIYASRQVSPGIEFSTDSIWEQELAAAFPYEETPDQMETIRDVKQDMQRPLPMDRLVCGDVGYGKTEVAVRAAFKAVNNGMQVAILVPTTVLAQQHFTTFTERLSAFPVSIESLSRFRSPKEQQKVLVGLASGAVDICIGTHRLIQQDVVFANLGLVIIDEEQKFGVAHKERFKKMRSEIDVLTLSATPIPRSLHMSLIGVRDMSTIETAPEARIPIKTQVSEYNDEVVREAILRELDRSGQVFFVHNRVQSIDAVAWRLKNLVPEARIAVGHGQMPEDSLETVMVDFINGETNVLVCTTIIESGLDLPSANTLIINQADRLGLTQLYHLRGRVGRGDVRAYAYLLYDKGKQLTEPASKRLRTIFEATELGAGFQIAMKDLEIRGAGNILGAEQSGHVGAVGFDLYCRLLSDTVKDLKSGDEKRSFRTEPIIDLPIQARIPDDYVPDLNTRLALYRRLAKIESVDQSKEMWGEMRDRFGDVPREIENMLYGVRIKLLAGDSGVQRVFSEGNQVVLTFGEDASVDRVFLQRSFGSSVKVGGSQVRLDRKKLGKHWMRILEEVLRMMSR